MDTHEDPLAALGLMRDEVHSLELRTEDLLLELERRAAPVVAQVKKAVAVQKRVSAGLGRHPGAYFAAAFIGLFGIGLLLGARPAART